MYVIKDKVSGLFVNGTTLSSRPALFGTLGSAKGRRTVMEGYRPWTVPDRGPLTKDDLVIHVATIQVGSEVVSG